MLRPVGLLSHPRWSRACGITRLRPDPLPSRAACQLPDLPTTIWVGLPPTGDPRRWGAHDIPALFRHFLKLLDSWSPVRGDILSLAVLHAKTSTSSSPSSRPSGKQQAAGRQERALVSFVRHGRRKPQSFPRKRGATRQTFGNALATDWIPAFAGMTGVSKGIPSQMTPPPKSEATDWIPALRQAQGKLFAGMTGVSKGIPSQMTPPPKSEQSNS